MINKKLTLLVTVVKLLTIISSVQANMFDHLPFSMMASERYSSMKPQKDVNVDWTRMYGNWFEVFRIRNS